MAQAVFKLRVLLHNSLLSTKQQAALDTAVLYFTTQHDSIHIAVHLLLAGAGSCVPLTPPVKRQLRVLINQKHVFQQLLDVIEAQRSLDSPAVPAVLRFLSTTSHLASSAVLNSLWSDRSALSTLISASCSSHEAATAAAKLAVAVARRGLPASALLQDTLLSANSSKAAAAASPPRAQQWAEVAMQPLLLQLQQEISCWNQLKWPGIDSRAAPAAADPQQKQEVWLLLCSCIDAASAAHYTPTKPIEDLLKQPAVLQALQTYLLNSQSVQAYSATVQLVNKLCSLSPDLAHYCFTAAAPVISELLHRESINQGKGSLSTAAASTMWQQLLLRLRGSFLTDIEAYLAQQLPLVASTVAQLAISNGSTTTKSASLGDATGSETSAMRAAVTAFTAAASSIISCVQPLLPRDPALVLAAVGPNAQALVHYVAAGDMQQQQQQEHALVALWLLQSYSHALQQQQQQQKQKLKSQCNTQCNNTITFDWSGVTAAVARLLECSSENLSTHAAQAAGLQLIRNVIALQTAAAAEAGEWQQLLLALAKLFERSQAAPSALAKRRLLLVACQLLSDLAQHMPQLGLLTSSPVLGCENSPAGQALNPVQAIGIAIPGSSSSSGGGTSTARGMKADNVKIMPVGELCGYLRALRHHLSRKRLERSCSVQDLLDAVDAALNKLGHFQLYVDVMYQRLDNDSVCLQLRLL